MATMGIGICPGMPVFALQSGRARRKRGQWPMACHRSGAAVGEKGGGLFDGGSESRAAHSVGCLDRDPVSPIRPDDYFRLVLRLEALSGLTFCC